MAFWLAFLGSSTGCKSPPHAEVVVVVDTDMVTPDELDRLVLVIDGEHSFEHDLTSARLPATLTLTSDGATSNVSVEASGYLGESLVVSERATTNFVQGASSGLVIWLLRRCRTEARACGAGLSCQPTGCVPETREGSSLPSSSAVLGGDHDAGSWSDPMDGGADAGVDAGPPGDAGPCTFEPERCDGEDNDCDGLIDEALDNNDVTSSLSASGPHEHCGRCGISCDECFAGNCGDVTQVEAVIGSSCFIAHAEGGPPGLLRCSPGTRLGVLGDEVPMSRLETGPPADEGTDGMLCVIGAERRVSCVSEDLPTSSGTCVCERGRCLRCPYEILSDAGNPAPGATDLAVGLRHACSIIEGQVSCWGFNDLWQLADDDTSLQTRTGFPVSVPGVSAFAQVVAGHDFTCAREAAGARRVYCWGRDRQRSQGQPEGAAPSPSPSPVVYISGAEVTGVTDLSCAGGALAPADLSSPHCCAVLEDGEVICWGSNGYGQIGGSPSPSPAAPTPLWRPTGMGQVRDVEVGPSVSCAVTVDEEVWCWGQAGAVLQQESGTDHGPVRIDFAAGVEVRDLSLSAGLVQIPIEEGRPSPQLHAVMRTWAGEVYCWGFNPWGQCRGAVGDVLTPVLVTP